MDQLLFIPGPVTVSADVLAACARPMIDHRGPEFAALQNGIIERLNQVIWLTVEHRQQHLEEQMFCFSLQPPHHAEIEETDDIVGKDKNIARMRVGMEGQEFVNLVLVEIPQGLSNPIPFLLGGFTVGKLTK